MFLNSVQSRARRQQGGALAIAIFIIVVMSLLTVAIGRNISSSTDQSVHEVFSARALFAAEYANEIALTALFPRAQGAIPANSDCAAVTTATSSFSSGFGATPGLANCVVVTSCNSITLGSDTYFQISSRGVCKDTSSSANPQTCLNTDRVCVSRTVEVEAR